MHFRCLFICFMASFPILQLQIVGHTMSARNSSSGSVAAASSSTADVPRPPPRRRAASVAGQQQRLDYNNGHTPRRSLAVVVSKGMWSGLGWAVNVVVSRLKVGWAVCKGQRLSAGLGWRTEIFVFLSACFALITDYICLCICVFHDIFTMDLIKKKRQYGNSPYKQA